MKVHFAQIKENDSGEVMLESTIVVTITIILMVAMLSLGFLFYQQAMLNSVAIEIATDIAVSYKYTGKDLNDYSISQESIDKIKKYRTSFLLTSFKELNQERAEAYIDTRVNLTSLGVNDSTPEIKKLDFIVDNVGRMHVDLQIEMKSEFLFSNVLVYLKIIDDTPTFTASARAECIDITAYASNVQYMAYIGRKIEDSKNDEISIINNVISTLNSIYNVILDIFT